MAGVLVEFTIGSGGCPLVRLTEQFPENSVEYVDMANLSNGEFVEEFLIRGADVEGFEDALRTAKVMDGFRRVERLEEGDICQGVLKGACVRSFLAARGWIPSRTVAARGKETVTLRLNDRDQLNGLMNDIREKYPDFELTRLMPADWSFHDSRALLAGVGLTAKQRGALRAAYEMGYFDSPRGMSASEIAAELKVDRSTFSRHLRIAMRKVTAALLK